MAQWDPSLILLKFTLIKVGKDMIKYYVSVAITIVRSLKDFRIWIVLRGKFTWHKKCLQKSYVSLGIDIPNFSTKKWKCPQCMGFN